MTHRGTMDEDLSRRADDRVMNSRLELLDQGYQSLNAKVLQLEASINVVKLEQSHFRELFESRFKIIERGQELAISKIDSIQKEIAAMADGPERTPMGRALAHDIKTANGTLDGLLDDQKALKEWQLRVDSIISVLKWMGGAGVGALLLGLLRMLKMVP